MSFNIPDAPKKRVVIVGGGFGGLKLCTALAKNTDYQIVLIDKNNFHQFPPLIYQIATSGLQVSSIAFPFRKMFAGSKNVFYRMCELRAVYPEDKVIQTSIGKLDYDYLVLATGTTTNYFGNSRLQEESMPMKTINEAMGLRNALLNTFERANTCSTEEERAELLNVVVVGGGPTGVEIAGALAEMREHVLPRDYPDLDTSLFKIHLVQGGARLLPAMSEKASKTSLEYLTRMGVDVQLKAYVHDYRDHEVILRDGRSFKSQTIIWVCGVTGRRIQGIDDKFYGPGNRLTVDSFNQVTGLDGVYAVGDCCIMTTEDCPKGHPQMAQAALQQGRNLARNFTHLSRNEPLESFTYKDLGSMATIGRNKAVADIFGMNMTGFTAWVLWMIVHLMSILGVKNKMSTVMDWAWSYFTYDKSNRTIISAKHPKVILERNYEISMRHWGELSREQAIEAERLADEAIKGSRDIYSLKTQESLARNAMKKAEAILRQKSLEAAAAAASLAGSREAAAAAATAADATREIIGEGDNLPPAVPAAAPAAAQAPTASEAPAAQPADAPAVQPAADGKDSEAK